MARLTVQDCLEHTGDRYELIMLASKRTRQIISGARLPMVEENGDKPEVIALREIAAGLINKENIEITKDHLEQLGGSVSDEQVAAVETSVSEESDVAPIPNSE